MGGGGGSDTAGPVSRGKFVEQAGGQAGRKGRDALLRLLEGLHQFLGVHALEQVAARAALDGLEQIAVLR